MINDMDGMMENILEDGKVLDPMAEPSGTVAIDDMERALLEFTKEAEEKRGIGVFDWNEMAKACVMEREDCVARDVRKMKVTRDMLRREAELLDREIMEIEREELDLIKARNGRIMWERRLGLVEIEKGLEIGGVEIRNHREIEVVARMFGEIEEGRK